MAEQSLAHMADVTSEADLVAEVVPAGTRPPFVPTVYGAAARSLDIVYTVFSRERAVAHEAVELPDGRVAYVDTPAVEVQLVSADEDAHGTIKILVETPALEREGDPFVVGEKVVVSFHKEAN